MGGSVPNVILCSCGGPPALTSRRARTKSPAQVLVKELGLDFNAVAWRSLTKLKASSVGRVSTMASWPMTSTSQIESRAVGGRIGRDQEEDVRRPRLPHQGKHGGGCQRPGRGACPRRPGRVRPACRNDQSSPHGDAWSSNEGMAAGRVGCRPYQASTGQVGGAGEDVRRSLPAKREAVSYEKTFTLSPTCAAPDGETSPSKEGAMSYARSLLDTYPGPSTSTRARWLPPSTRSTTAPRPALPTPMMISASRT